MRKLDAIEKKMEERSKFRDFAVLKPGQELTPETKVFYHETGWHHEYTLEQFHKLFPGAELDVCKVEYVEWN